MILQFADHIGTDAGIVHQADKSGPQFHIGDILRHITAYAAVDLLYPAHIAALGNEHILRVALDIYEYCADHNNTHDRTSILFYYYNMR